MYNQNRLIPWTLLLPVLVILCAVCMVACVINDWKTAFDVCGFAGLALLIVQVVCALVLLFSRKFKWFFAHLGLLVLALVVWFLAMMIMALGQHHPPQHAGDVDSTYIDVDTTAADTLWDDDTNE